MTHIPKKTIKPIKAFVDGGNLMKNVVKTKQFQLAFSVTNQPVAYVHKMVLE